MKQSKEKIPGNVAIIDRPEATYRIVYEAHAKSFLHNPEEIGEPDIFVAEGVNHIKDVADAQGTAETYFSGEGGDFGKEGAKRSIEPYLKDKHVPVCFVDITGYRFITDQHENMSNVVRAVEMMATVPLVKHLMHAVERGVKKMTRRDFVKAGFAALFATKGMMQTAILPTSLAQYDNRRLSGVERAILMANERINPEAYAALTTLRNAVFAYKLKVLARSNIQKDSSKNRSKPELCMIVGQFHCGIEEALALEERELLSVIHTILKALHYVSLVMGTPPFGVAQMTFAEFDSKKGRWVENRVVNMPELEAIQESAIRGE